jgi:hypothetical protein
MSGTTETSGSPRDDDRDEDARLRNQEHHAEVATHREEQALANQARRLADEMATLIVDEERTEAD